MLPGATIEAAYVIAERIRFRFAEVGAFATGHPVNATVSGGVASASSETTVEAILHLADESRYRAKTLGRNRVERPVTGHADTARNIIRIA